MGWETRLAAVMTAALLVAAAVLLQLLSAGDPAVPWKTAWAESATPGRELLVREALALLSRIQYLEEKGVNTTTLARGLNKTFALIQAGRLGEAYQELRRVAAETSRLEETATQHYLYTTASKAAVIAALLLVPVLFYLYFPRLYARLWLWLHRRWLVDESPRR